MLKFNKTGYTPNGASYKIEGGTTEGTLVIFRSFPWWGWGVASKDKMGETGLTKTKEDAIKAGMDAAKKLFVE